MLFFCTSIVQTLANSMLKLVASAHTVQPHSACTVHTVGPHSLFTQYYPQYTHSTLAVQPHSTHTVHWQYSHTVHTQYTGSTAPQYTHSTLAVQPLSTNTVHWQLATQPQLQVVCGTPRRNRRNNGCQYSSYSSVWCSACVVSHVS